MTAWLAGASLLGLFLVEPLHTGARPLAFVAAAASAGPSVAAPARHGQAHDPDQCLLCRATAPARAALRTAAGSHLPAATGVELPAQIDTGTRVAAPAYASDAPPRAPPSASLPHA